MLRFVYLVLSLGCGGALSYGIVRAWSDFAPFVLVSNARSSQYTISYADFVAVMLTGVSVILAALGFVLAIIAVIGWNSIGDRVSTLAVSFLKESVKDGGELHELVKQEAKQIIYRGIEAVEPEAEYEQSTEGTK